MISRLLQEQQDNEEFIVLDSKHSILWCHYFPWSLDKATSLVQNKTQKLKTPKDVRFIKMT